MEYNNRIRKTVSFYNNSEDSRSKRYLNLDYVLLEIIPKDEELRKQTEITRNQITEEDFKKEKKKLPMIAPSGKFSYRNDDLNNLQEYSNILILDFDKFPDHEATVKFKEKLIKYADRLYIYAIWFSASNKGLKVAMLHDNTTPEHHYNLFWQVKNNLYPNTEEFDKKCGNLSRPDVWLNPNRNNLAFYHFTYDPSILDPPEKDYNKGWSSKEFKHTEDEIKLNSIFQVRWNDKQLTNYIDKCWRKEYPDSYKDGNRHKSILSRAKWLCLYGVLFDNAVSYLKATFGKHGIDDRSIEEMAINNYNSNRGKFGSKRNELYQRKENGKMYRISQLNATK